MGVWTVNRVADRTANSAISLLCVVAFLFAPLRVIFVFIPTQNEDRPGQSPWPAGAIAMHVRHILWRKMVEDPDRQ
jgi:hypothetical protein